MSLIFLSYVLSFVAKILWLKLCLIRPFKIEVVSSVFIDYFALIRPGLAHEATCV